MIPMIQNHIKKISLILIVSLLVLSSGFFAEEGEGTSGRAEEALKNCLKDAFSFIAVPTMFAQFVIYCFIGYAFVKKYIRD